MKEVWVDTTRDICKSYAEFYNEIVREGTNNPFIYEDNPYEVFVKIFRNLICEKVSMLLDADFTDLELEDIELSKEKVKSNIYIQNDKSGQFGSFEEILRFIKEKEENLKIEILTSGTTGRPKKVSQTLKNVIRAVKQNDKLKNDVWGFAYNPTHFAGLQVFFQTIFNRNTNVYLFNNDFERIKLDIEEYNVEYLSCTPTFMKMLLPHFSSPYETMKSLTFGGEKLDTRILDKIKITFPKAKLNNVYASTEAGSLLRAKGDFFEIPERYKALIKIDEDELIIHKELIGSSDSLSLTDDGWYRTGDLVKILDEGFRFVSRKSEMINVGGYKVNPSEVEEIIKKLPDVQDVIVFGRKNALMGAIIAAHVIKVKESNLLDKELKQKIKEITSNSLQDFKIPRSIKIIERFDVTRTGKIKKS